MPGRGYRDSPLAADSRWLNSAGEQVRDVPRKTVVSGFRQKLAHVLGMAHSDCFNADMFHAGIHRGIETKPRNAMLGITRSKNTIVGSWCLQLFALSSKPSTCWFHASPNQFDHGLTVQNVAPTLRQRPGLDPPWQWHPWTRERRGAACGDNA